MCVCVCVCVYVCKAMFVCASRNGRMLLILYCIIIHLCPIKIEYEAC